MLYIADSLNENIRKLTLNQPDSVGSVVVSLEYNPTSIYVDDDNDTPTIYVALSAEDDWVEKWTYGSSSGVPVGDKCSSCIGISIDNEKNVYIADSFNELVMKWSPKTNTTTIIASEDDEFETTDQCLSYPRDLYINQIDNSLYVVDKSKHRVQKWSNDGKIRITVAGSSVGQLGTDAVSLYFPEGVFVDDESETVYVADSHNDRVQRWLVHASEGETIVGGYGSGDSADQLNLPTALDFDNEGNLYVCDNNNKRIQKFNIIDNRPCPATSKRTTPLKTTSSATTAITTTITIGKSLPSTTTYLLTTNTSTTALNNHAVCSYWNCCNAWTRTIVTQLIILWIIEILF